MIKYLKYFFYPPVYTYSYIKSKGAVIKELQEIFSCKVTLFSSNDINGKFISENKFLLEAVSFAYTRGVKYGALLEAEITEVKDQFTVIKTTARPNPIWYLLFSLAIIFSFVLLYKYISTTSIKFLLGSLAVIIVGPFLSVALSNIGVGIIRERYYLHIHKKLKL